MQHTSSKPNKYHQQCFQRRQFFWEKNWSETQLVSAFSSAFSLVFMAKVKDYMLFNRYHRRWKPLSTNTTHGLRTQQKMTCSCLPIVALPSHSGSRRSRHRVCHQRADKECVHRGKKLCWQCWDCVCRLHPSNDRHCSLLPTCWVCWLDTLATFCYVGQFFGCLCHVSETYCQHTILHACRNQY